MRNVLSALILLVAAAIIPATASAKGPSLDHDVLSSVVPITVNGAFVGTGVVVTNDGLVLTASALTPFGHGERIVVESDLPRAATIVLWDEALGIAVLQMHGVIPRPASVAKTELRPKGAILAVYRTAKRSTLQIELYGKALLTDQAFTPVFAPKTGQLLSVTVRATADRAPRTYGPASIKRFISQAKGGNAKTDHH